MVYSLPFLIFVHPIAESLINIKSFCVSITSRVAWIDIGGKKFEKRTMRLGRETDFIYQLHHSCIDTAACVTKRYHFLYPK